MSDEELTAEEQAALEAMQSEGKPTEDPESTPSEPEPDTRSDPVEEVEAAVSDLEAKAPEQDEPEPIEPKKQAPPEGYVPHGAMHAERTKRQELERKLAELEARLPKPEEEKPPQYVDPLEDPEGFRRYDEHQRKMAQDRLDQMEQSRQQAIQQRERVEEAARLEQEFAQKTTDYPDAVQHLHSARVQQLREAGFSDQEINQQVRQDAESVFDAAKQIGMNPAQLLYLRAQEYGYRKAAPGVPDEGQKIEALASAQRNTQGLGNVGGGEQKGQLTIAQLAEMSEAELAKVPEEDIARLMGG